MEKLGEQVTGYLKSAGFEILETGEGYAIADQLSAGGDRDTRVVWFLPPPVDVADFGRLERKLRSDLDRRTHQYPTAKWTIVAYSREGLSRDFLSELNQRRVRLLVPIQFFDAPFRGEETSRAVQSAISALREADESIQRVPQPYSTCSRGEETDGGEDLLPLLVDELKNVQAPRLRIVAGPAGAGKTVLFKALFRRVYDHFIAEKRRQTISPRPIPLIPDFLSGRSARTLRTTDLIRRFIEAELAARIPVETFGWMLENGYATWLFDGLDELYSGDEEFFDDVLEWLTEPGSVANILICTRESLLTSSQRFAEFLEEFGETAEVKIYRLEGWPRSSKRSFAWAQLEGCHPPKGAQDPPRVAGFLEAVEGNESTKSLSAIPYFCGLLLDEYLEGGALEFRDDIALTEKAVARIIRREEEKGLLLPEQYESGELPEWLDTVAAEFYASGFTGVSELTVKEYGEAVLRPELSPDERHHALMTLLQFPLFTAGPEAGAIRFQHELVAEHLAARRFWRQLRKMPEQVAIGLGTRIDLSTSMAARYLAIQLQRDPAALLELTGIIRTHGLPGRSFGNLLSVLLLADPSAEVVGSHNLSLENRDLSYVEFRERDLSGVSFRHSNLTSTVFDRCCLRDAFFEGAYLVGTRFTGLASDGLRGAQFGNLEHFQYFHIGKERIDDHHAAGNSLAKLTGEARPMAGPCPSAIQLRNLFLKFVRPDGQPRRDQLRERALIRGKRHPDAPAPEVCIAGSTHYGFLDGPDNRRRYRRRSGEHYNEVIQFVRNWVVQDTMGQLLNSLCDRAGCSHVPGA